MKWTKEQIESQLDIIESLFERGFKDVHTSIKSPKHPYRDVINPVINELKSNLKHYE